MTMTKVQPRAALALAAAVVLAATGTLAAPADMSVHVEFYGEAF